MHGSGARAGSLFASLENQRSPGRAKEQEARFLGRTAVIVKCPTI